MKSTVLFALFLLSAAANGFVIDKDGKPVANGGTYYVLPFFGGNGGGLKLAATGGETCSLTVVQSPSDNSKGSPIKISSHFRIAVVTTGLPLNIEFIDAPKCVPSRSWGIVPGLPEGLAVKVGYRNAIGGSFFIRETVFENVYKFEFCESGINDNCGHMHLGISTDKNGNRRLVIAPDDKPLLVQFKRAEKDYILLPSTDDE